MANRASISELIKLVAQSNLTEWRELVRLAQLDPRVDFRQANLREVDFNGADLSGFDFRGAILDGSTFNGAFVSDLIVEDVYIETGLFDKAYGTPKPASKIGKRGPLTDVFSIPALGIDGDAALAISRAEEHWRPLACRDVSERFDITLDPVVLNSNSDVFHAIQEGRAKAGIISPGPGQGIIDANFASHLVSRKIKVLWHYRAPSLRSDASGQALSTSAYLIAKADGAIRTELLVADAVAVTAVLFSPRKLTSAIYKCLQGFAIAGVNIRNFSMWTFAGAPESVCLIEIDGRPDDALVRRALAELKFYTAQLVIWGCFPSASVQP